MSVSWCVRWGALAVGLSCVPPAAADESRAGTAAKPGAYLHDGFFARLGLGIGWVRADTSTPSAREIGSNVEESLSEGVRSLTLGIGGTPLPGLVVGGMEVVHLNASPVSTELSVDGERRDVRYEDLALFVFGGFVDYYPDPTDGWHVLGGLGLGGFVVEDGSTDLIGNETVPSHNLFGPGLSLAGGYELWAGRQFSVGALIQADLVLGMLGDSDKSWKGYAIAGPSFMLEGTIH